jgi:hypothetical protein
MSSTQTNANKLQKRMSLYIIFKNNKNNNDNRER